jgi:uncharacterized protein (DUF2235 family)
VSDATRLLATFEPLAPGGPPADQPLRLIPPDPGGIGRDPAEKLNQDPIAVRDQPKRIVISADGTWNTPGSVEHGRASPTNVWLLHQFVSPRAGDGTPQVAYYHPGVGTGGFFDRLLGGIAGVGLERNIVDCYRILIQCYRPGDAVYLFGFSRGAYTVRSLAGLVRNSGIIDRNKHSDAELDAVIAEAYQLYRKRGAASAPASLPAVDFRARHSHPDFRITCIGVWDTVGALGIPVGLLGRLTQHRFGFHDVTLSSRVDRAFHAVAVDERRRPFIPTLWEQQPGAPAAGQHLEQAWFAGVHSDVGGGYAVAQRDLANLTLRWMVNRVTRYCRLELDTRALAAAVPGEVTLHDSYTWYYRLMGGPRTRDIDGGLGQYGVRDPFRVTAERLHASVTALRGPDYAPPNVDDYERRLAVERTTAAVPPTPSTDLKNLG